MVCFLLLDSQGDPFFITWLFKPLMLGQSLNNMGEMEDYMEVECPDIEYTSVRPPQLTNTETTGEYVKARLYLLEYCFSKRKSNYIINCWTLQLNDFTMDLYINCNIIQFDHPLFLY